jgi:hypothetical protein
VLVGAMVADVASRLFGYRPLRPDAVDPGNYDQLDWEARTMGLRAAARAVAEDDPGVWADSLLCLNPEWWVAPMTSWAATRRWPGVPDPCQRDRRSVNTSSDSRVKLAGPPCS